MKAVTLFFAQLHLPNPVPNRRSVPFPVRLSSFRRFHPPPKGKISWSAKGTGPFGHCPKIEVGKHHGTRGDRPTFPCPRMRPVALPGTAANRRTSTRMPEKTHEKSAAALTGCSASRSCLRGTRHGRCLGSSLRAESLGQETTTLRSAEHGLSPPINHDILRMAPSLMDLLA